MDDYYQVIVTNNLFRPLGWKEKKSGPSYTLLGTVIARNRGDSKALIKNTKQTYYVAVGDKIGNATVEKIVSKKVVLHQPNGGSLELKLGPLAFLNVPREIPVAPRETPVEGRVSEGAPLLASSKKPPSQLESGGIEASPPLQFTPRIAALWQIAIQDPKPDVPLSRQHKLGSTTLGFSRPVSREKAAALLEIMRWRWEEQKKEWEQEKRERSSP